MGWVREQHETRMNRNNNNNKTQKTIETANNIIGNLVVESVRLKLKKNKIKISCKLQPYRINIIIILYIDD